MGFGWKNSGCVIHGNGGCGGAGQCSGGALIGEIGLNGGYKFGHYCAWFCRSLCFFGVFYEVGFSYLAEQ